MKTEATGFVRGGMLFLVPVWEWAKWDRAIWKCQDFTYQEYLEASIQNSLIDVIKSGKTYNDLKPQMVAAIGRVIGEFEDHVNIHVEGSSFIFTGKDPIGVAMIERLGRELND